MRDADVLEKNPHISRSALEEIHEQVFGWALSRCNYEHVVAEDLVQEAYVALLTGKAKFEKRSTLRTFVFSVVQNLARGRYRRKASRLRLVQKIAQEASDECVEPPEEIKTDGLWRAVQELPQRQRDIVELVFCRDMTIDEASRVMGVTVGTGRVHYDRAKKTLRIKLDEQR